MQVIEAAGKTGHLIADCFQSGGGKAGQYPHWWKGKRSTSTPNIAANLATTSSSTPSGNITPGTHYALSASIDADEIERLIAENARLMNAFKLLPLPRLQELYHQHV